MRRVCRSGGNLEPLLAPDRHAHIWVSYRNMPFYFIAFLMFKKSSDLGDECQRAERVRERENSK